MRLEITHRADLAVRALVALQSSPDRLKSADLAELLGTTSGFVPEVMGPLVRIGWVRSVPGPAGGYERQRDLDSLTVLEVVETRRADRQRPLCRRRALVRRSEPFALHVAWARARHELRDSLGRLRLSEVSAA